MCDAAVPLPNPTDQFGVALSDLDGVADGPHNSCQVGSITSQSLLPIITPLPHSHSFFLSLFLPSTLPPFLFSFLSFLSRRAIVRWPVARATRSRASVCRRRALQASVVSSTPRVPRARVVTATIAPAKRRRVHLRRAHRRSVAPSILYVVRLLWSRSFAFSLVLLLRYCCDVHLCSSRSAYAYANLTVKVHGTHTYYRVARATPVPVDRMRTRRARLCRVRAPPAPLMIAALPTTAAR
jgi:hypothetical protein